jgi:hypothetical protein
MKLHKDVDLGKSFEKLKSALLKTVGSTKGNNPARYAASFGELSMAVKIHLVQCSDLTLKDIQDEIEGPDDIPSGLFSRAQAIEEDIEGDKNISGNH